ncbi:MAG: hypothetical protein F6J87_30425 [Spirulina sp. SIO3F2]|nr:hypothetical protein [Spirulina sp. SIO3F2]
MPDFATVQVAVPFAWLAKVEKLAQERDRSNQEILQAAIAQYLGVPLPNQDSRLGQLEAQVHALKTQLSQLNRTINHFQNQPQPASTPPLETPTQPVPSGNWIDDDDDDVDEPDEVLLDFLPPEER